jgi:hypothetical protein
VIAALLLAALQEVVEPEPTPPPPPHACHAWDAGLGIGLWWLGTFEASTPVGVREITGDMLVEADLELSFSSHEWTFTALLSAASTDDSDILLGGLELRTPPLLEAPFTEGFPMALTAAAGVLGGSYDVELDGFGTFKPGFGGQARLTLETSRLDALRVALWAGVRFIEFEYDEATLSGDDAIGGAGIVVGISGLVRF